MQSMRGVLPEILQVIKNPSGNQSLTALKQVTRTAAKEKVTYQDKMCSMKSLAQGVTCSEKNAIKE